MALCEHRRKHSVFERLSGTITVMEMTDRPLVPSMNEEHVRRFLHLAIAYSLSVTLSGIGFYFYVVIPLWLWFALSSRRVDSSQSIRRARRLLVLNLVLWIAFTVPLFFFIVVFGPLVYAAEVSVVLTGSTLMYLAADSPESGNPRIAIARKIGLAAGAATAANLLVSGVLLALAIGRTVSVTEVATAYALLSIGGLVASIISALSFVRIAMWTRKRVSVDAQP